MPFPNPCGSKCFAGQHHIEEEFTIRLFVERQQRDDRRKHRLAVVSVDVVENSATTQCFSEGRERIAQRATGVGQLLDRERHAEPSRPFEQLGSMKAVTIAYLSIWNAALTNPFVDLAL
ncbi:MAG: hypothetical protein QM784_33820 [Polyangiaceae bacterium]